VDGSFFIRGLIVGFSIAAPVGPIGVLCIRRTLADGYLTGFVSGLGAATADALYGTVAAFGLTSIAVFLVGHQLALRLIGGLFLCYLGYRIFVTAPMARTVSPGGRGLGGAYFSTVVLTITNPATILSFAAVFTGLGLGSTRGNYAAAGLLVVGVFVGSALWWALLSGMTTTLRSRLDLEALRWVNRISGAVIGAFGVIVLLTATRST